MTRTMILAGLALAAAAAAAGAKSVTKESVDKKALAASVNAFAFDLYGELRGREGNLFFSPYSVESALAMVHAGARGETAAAMAKTLHLGADTDAVLAGFGRLNAQFNTSGKPYQLSVANALWGLKGYTFEKPYLERVREHFGATFEPLDFQGDRAGSARTINAWCDRQTRSKIREIVAATDFDDQTRLVLTNAIYFLGTWLNTFDKARTKDEDFFAAPGRTTRAAMMHETAHWRHFDGGDLEALEMAYKGNDLAMLVLLPKQKGGLAALEASLTAGRLAQIGAGLKWAYVDLALPKFRMEWGAGLEAPLKALGMAVAFAPGKADLAGINAGREPLWIAFVKHKAFVRVDEEGTEAAAVTAMGVGGSAMPPKPISFRADHPFLFLIRDVQSGCILFMGRVADPTKDR
jgi:serpin B